jgi:ABC-2 type transport system ATP-binding protein
MGVDPVHDSGRLRDLIGVQLQTSGLPDTITVRESMRLLCAYHGVAPRYDLLERMGLADKLNTQYHMLSTGQKRRLALALAVAHQPPLVLLDEPTAGLDVQSRVDLHDLMRELQTNGTTIILSTHDMAEAEKMADRVAILLHGKLAMIATPRELTAAGAGLTKISVSTEHASVSELTQLPAVSHRTAKEGYDVYYSTDTATTISALLEGIKNANDVLIDLRVERPSLEDRFLEITSQPEAMP